MKVLCDKFTSELIGNLWTQPANVDIELKITGISNKDEILKDLHESGQIINFIKKNLEDFEIINKKDEKTKELEKKIEELRSLGYMLLTMVECNDIDDEDDQQYVKEARETLYKDRG